MGWGHPVQDAQYGSKYGSMAMGMGIEDRYNSVAGVRLAALSGTVPQ